MNNLDQLMKDVNKKFKANIVNQGVVDKKIPRIPFSSPRLNYMSYGGIPTGRITEFAGDEGGGKTTTALDLAKNAQKLFPDRKVMYIDCENTLDTNWAELLGVNVEDLILLKPETETAEQIFEIALDFIESGEISLIVIDSLGVMISAQAYDKTMEEKTYGGISASLTLFSKKAVPLLARHRCTLVGINQMRDDMNSTYGGSITTGGRAWKHNCSMRLAFQRDSFVDDKGAILTRGCENPAGNIVKCTITKSKVCRPDRKVGSYTLKYLEGIDYISDTIDVGVKEGIVLLTGAWYTLVNLETGEIAQDSQGKLLKFQGKANLKEFLSQNLQEFTDLSDNVNLRIL